MILKTIMVGPFQCNCFVLGCEESKEAILIDPGDEADRLLEEIESNQLKIKQILLTHGHLDHVAGLSKLKEKLDAPILLHEGDKHLYDNLPMQGRLFGISLDPAPPSDGLLEEGQLFSFGKHQLKVLHTPGHSPGSVSFQLLGEPGMVFCGDTLFYQSIGRSDLWGGNAVTLIESIKDRLLVLDDRTEVHPGHGPSTLIGEEKQSNPFLV